jgi:hypothetical protein
MIKVKEFKGTAQNPNVDNQINAFFETLTENDQIADIYYSTALLPVKKEGAVQYIITSTAMILYATADE